MLVMFWSLILHAICIRLKPQQNIVVCNTGEDQQKGDDAIRPEEAEVWHKLAYCVESLA